MFEPLAAGDRAIVEPPFDDDPIIVSLQRHARVAAVLPRPGPDGAVYMLQLGGTLACRKPHPP